MKILKIYAATVLLPIAESSWVGPNTTANLGRLNGLAGRFQRRTVGFHVLVELVR